MVSPQCPGGGFDPALADVVTVLQTIDQGGPFRFPSDALVFNNREALLPVMAAGYYLEYTVPTPGVPGRGVRRIIAGHGGEAYFTIDHYRSFQRIR